MKSPSDVRIKGVFRITEAERFSSRALGWPGVSKIVLHGCVKKNGASSGTVQLVRTNSSGGVFLVHGAEYSQAVLVRTDDLAKFDEIVKAGI